MIRSIRNTSLKHLTATLVMGVTMAGITQTAEAGSRVHSPRQVEVQFGDLNLDKEAGAATLLSRLSRASKKVCNFAAPGPFNFDQNNLPSVCRKNALEKAIADVDHPMLTALYRNQLSNPGERLASR